MALRVFVGPGDLRLCRFATSPVWDVLQACRAFVDPRVRPYALPWWRQVRHTPRPRALNAVQVRRGYNPDFLNPPPAIASPRIEDELALIRATPVGQVTDELRRCLAYQTRAPARAVLEELIDGPAAARERLADELETSWRLLVLPWWPRIRELFDADIGRRSRALATEGLGAVVAGLHEDVGWDGEAIVVRRPAAGERVAGGAGVVLMPTVFGWPDAQMVTEPPWQPTLIYPVPGIGGLWSAPPAPPAALARLLGATRAQLLVSLADPASTTVLAQRYGLSPGGVSAHLSALAGAGLLVRQRYGHEVRYRRTPLGDGLAAGVVLE